MYQLKLCFTTTNHSHVTPLPEKTRTQSNQSDTLTHIHTHWYLNPHTYTHTNTHIDVYSDTQVHSLHFHADIAQIYIYVHITHIHTQRPLSWARTRRIIIRPCPGSLIAMYSGSSLILYQMHWSLWASHAHWSAHSVWSLPISSLSPPSLCLPQNLSKNGFGSNRFLNLVHVIFNK